MRQELKLIKKALKADKDHTLQSRYLTNGDDIEGLAVFNADRDSDFSAAFNATREYLDYCLTEEDMPAEIYEDLAWQVDFADGHMHKDTKAVFFNTVANPGFIEFKSNKELLSWLKEQVSSSDY